MPSVSRRNALLGLTTAAVAAGGLRLWTLHQSLPPRDPAAEDRFRQAQDRLIAESGGALTGRFVQLSDPQVRTHILEGGSGDPVLFLHGGYGFAAQWEPLLSRIAQGFHVYAPDRPGCGLTDPFDYTGVPFREHAVSFVRSTLDALGVDRARLVGNSMGAYFGLVFALAHPERVSHLITLGEPAGSSDRITGAHRLLATRGVNGLLFSTVMKPGPAATLEGFRRVLVAHPERLSQATLDAGTAASLIPGATESWLTLLENVVPRDGRSTLTYALRPELPALRMPAYLIWGERDTFGPPTLATEMAALMPKGHAVNLPDAGHLVWLDQPGPVEALVRSFLNS